VPPFFDEWHRRAHAEDSTRTYQQDPPQDEPRL
jgi:hypothetical protein